MSSFTDLRPMLAAVGEDRASDACARAVEVSRADQTEVFLAARSGEYTRFAGTRIHQPQDISEWTLMVRCVVAGRAARAATSDLGSVEKTVDRATRAARAQAAASAPRHAHEVNRRSPEVRLPADLLWRADALAWDAPARAHHAHEAMRQADLAGGQAFGMFGRAVTELAVTTSAGAHAYCAATEATGRLTVRIDDGSSHWANLDRGPVVFGLSDAIARTVNEALAARRRRELPDGTYDVVLGPLATGELLDGFGAFGFTGSAVVDGVGAVATRRGERVAAPLITIADDATSVRGLPFPFDQEGTGKSRVTLLERGVVGDAVTDLATAGTGPSTGHAHIAREESPRAIPANLHLEPGPMHTDQLIAGVERGVYVQRFWYTRVVDAVATTFTGVSRDACFLIEDGQLTQPVHGKRFTESAFGVLDRTDAVGDSVLSQPLMNVWNGAVTAPSLRVRGFRFGPAAANGTGR